MPNASPKTVFSRSPDLIAADMDGDTVMMSIEHGEYYGLGGVGTRVWELLAQPMSMSDLAERICAEFEVDPPTCLADLTLFLTELKTQGLVEAREIA